MTQLRKELIAEWTRIREGGWTPADALAKLIARTFLHLLKTTP